MAKNTKNTRERIAKKAATKAKKAEERHGHLGKAPNYKLAFIADNFAQVKRYISHACDASREHGRISSEDYKWMMDFSRLLRCADMPTDVKVLQKLMTDYTRDMKSGFRPRYEARSEVAILPPMADETSIDDDSNPELVSETPLLEDEEDLTVELDYEELLVSEKEEAISGIDQEKLANELLAKWSANAIAL